MTFRQIAHITAIKEDEVERLIIHVLSIGLMEGLIDEEREVFLIKSLKPRKLDKKRME